MEKFLERVAADLWARYGEGVGELKVILPNVRTRVFFVDALSKVASRPVFSPEFVSIDSLMTSLSGLGRVDPIVAITELFRIYSSYGPQDEEKRETFDSFYHWGEVLLNDYDAVDKYLINADMLFGNIADLKEIDAALGDYLNEEQIDIVKRFWREFDASRRTSFHKEEFLSVWRRLLPVYHDFRKRLEEMCVGYTGMIYRRAAELLHDHKAELPEGRYVVVGFNALSAAEKRLFSYLRSAHEADFYWDWDDYYLNDEKQEAGLFLRQNVKDYPAPATFNPQSSFALPKQINVISTASDSLQCKYVGEFVEDILKNDKKIDRNTAIVLTDEGLLSPLLYSLPDSIESVNVTMGYPLKSTLAYSFTERLLQLQQRARLSRAGKLSFYHKDAEGLLGHPYVVALDGELCKQLKADLIKRGRMYVGEEQLVGHHPIIDKIFSHCPQREELGAYVQAVLGEIVKVDVAAEDKARRALRRECFGLICEAVTKVDNSLRECNVEMKLATYVSLLRRVLQGVRIPYSGEPLSGVQVMGILETRNLDFENVVLLSMNDDNFPSGRLNDISFIPHNLRYAYGMPTPQHNEGVYAYYFYRLIQRAHRVDMVYCSVANDRSTGEQSRYIYQLDFESPHILNRIDKSLNVNLAQMRDFVVEKRGDVMRRLEAFLKEDEEGKRRHLSPSAFNNYMECPLKFYFGTIAGLRTEEEIEEGVDEAAFGSIFHKAMELLYTPMVERHLKPADFLLTITPEKIHERVVEAITKEYFAGEEVPEGEYGGNLRLVADTAEKYIRDCVLPFDLSQDRGVYEVYRLEQPMTSEFFFEEGRSVMFFGLSDRIDKMPDGSLRIIDYKTGSLHKDFAGLAKLLSRHPEGRNGAVVQTLIYSMMAQRMQQEGRLDGRGATPSLYYVRFLNQKEYSPLLNDTSSGLPVNSYNDYAEEFEQTLSEVLCEMFSPEKPFVPTDDEKVCEWCDFRKLCRR